MSEWKPINTAPTDGKRVLVYMPPDDRFGVRGAFAVVDMSDPERVRNPTHWMALPSAPKGYEGE